MRAARVERFGAILQLPFPRALVFTDRARARTLGLDGGHLWRGEGDGEVGAELLSAPLEAHIQLTNQCDVGCQGCYTGSTANRSTAEWGREEWLTAIDKLSEMGVFHLALGGGESALLPWLGDIARHAKERGMIPNLTTSGLAGLHNIEPHLEHFGQINVSIDGLGDMYRKVRGIDGFAEADRAVRKLRSRKREIGINTVVTRHNYAQIPAIFAYAKKRRLNEVELLRFKPSGRGRNTYESLRCSAEQHRNFLPVVLAAARRHRVRVRVDCSYTPMIAFHEPGVDLLRQLTVYGCTAGDFLIGAKATGAVTGCSFAPAERDRFKVDELPQRWQRESSFSDFRKWRDAEDPCRSCNYHSLCRGGCKVVSLHKEGTLGRPDPECPAVVASRPVRRSRGRSLPLV